MTTHSRFAFLLGLGLLLAPWPALAGGGVKGEGDKPRRPVSGEPTWTQPIEPEKLVKLKEKAAKLYIEGLREVEKARAGMYREKQLKTMAVKDPESGEKAIRMRKYTQEHLKHAMEKFKQSVKLDSKVADSWNLLGFTRLKTGDIEGAFDALETALALKPAHIPAHENIAEAYLQQGRIKEAREELEWLKKRGNMATLETTNLQDAIEVWNAENQGKEPKN